MDQCFPLGQTPHLFLEVLDVIVDVEEIPQKKSTDPSDFIYVEERIQF